MLPSLPTEIIHHIIKHSIPISSLGTAKDRHRQLLAFSLVNSTWRALATKEYLQELFLPSSQRMNEALRTFDERSTRRVMSIWLGTRQSYDSEQLKKARVDKIKIPPSVKKIVVSSLRLELRDVPFYTEIESLHLRWSDLGSRTPWPAGSTSILSAPVIPRFISLTSLTLLDIFLYEESFPLWTSWLTSCSYPLLQRLTLGLTDNGERLGAEDDLQVALSHLAPQLTSFALVQGASTLGVTDAFPWRAFTSLHQLALYPQNYDPSALISCALQRIATPLSLLRIGDSRDLSDFNQLEVAWQQKATKQLCDAFDEDLPSARKLERLVLECGTAEMGGESEARILQLRRCMLERGGCLAARVGWGGREGQLSWERFLEPW